jgi:hypothetical protein
VSYMAPSCPPVMPQPPLRDAAMISRQCTGSPGRSASFNAE